MNSSGLFACMGVFLAEGKHWVGSQELDRPTAFIKAHGPLGTRMHWQVLLFSGQE
jgi:hypothetical protein